RVSVAPTTEYEQHHQNDQQGFHAITSSATTLRSGRTVAYWTFVHMARKGSSMTWRPERRNASMPKRAPAAGVEELLAQLGHFRDVLGNRRSGRPSWGAFLQGIRVEKTTRQAVLRWYRLPRPSFQNGGAEGARTPDPKTARAKD